MYTIVSLISIFVMCLMNKFTTQIFIIIMVLYLYICLYLALKYWNLVNKKIPTLLKGE